jgi:hypothetical protein
MFHDPRYDELAREINRQIDHEINLRRPISERDPDAEGGGRRRGPEADGVSAHPDGLTFNGRTYTQAQVDGARAFLAAHNYPATDSWLAQALQMLHHPEGRP